MSREKILLVNPPASTKIFRDNYCSFSSKADYYWPPIDLLVLSGILSESYDVQMIDAIGENVDSEECLQRIRNTTARAIFFITGTASWKNDHQFMKLCKEATGATIIGSGGIFLTKGEEFLLRFDFLDAVLLNYTNKTIIDYLKGNLKNIVDLVYRYDNKIIQSKRSSNEPFSYPMPQHHLFPLNKYNIPTSQKKPISCMITSFGCPYSCRFCICSLLPYRKRQIDNIREELLYARKIGIRDVFFCDPTFTADPNHAQQICNIFLEEKLPLRWSCNIHVRTVDRKLLSLMRQSGCHTVLIGVESGNNAILERYAKRITIKMIKEVFQWCKQVGLQTGGYFIIGLPGETRETIQQTIDFACLLNPDFASFSIATPDIGTALWKEALEKGWYDEAVEEFDSTEYPVLNLTEIPQKEIWQLRQKAYRKFYFRPRYIFSRLKEIDNLSNFTATVRYGYKVIIDQFR